MTETLEDLLSDLEDAKKTLSSVEEDLDSAETVETVADFTANVNEALKGARSLVNELTSLLNRAKQAKE